MQSCEILMRAAAVTPSTVRSTCSTVRTGASLFTLTNYNGSSLMARTNRYEAVMSDKGYPVKSNHDKYPVPQRETDLNTRLSQNLGYN
jgi:hypothetical protein